MRSRFDIKLTLGLVVALTAAIAVFHLIVFLSIAPTSLSAAVPTATISSAVIAGHTK